MGLLKKNSLLRKKGRRKYRRPFHFLNALYYRRLPGAMDASVAV
jgi:hypothetical protein